MQEKPGKIRISVRHVKAARGLLDWTVQQLAERANISAATIHNWENHRHQPQKVTREAIQKTFEDAGIEFSNGRRPGVALQLGEDCIDEHDGTAQPDDTEPMPSSH